MVISSFPRTIRDGGKQMHQDKGRPPSRGPPSRHGNKWQENKWALRQCTHCRENFIPSTDELEFCSGDCKMSFSLLRQSREGNLKRKAP
ncbi:unnamed protein product [Ascophyllum nodosum]